MNNRRESQVAGEIDEPNPQPRNLQTSPSKPNAVPSIPASVKNQSRNQGKGLENSTKNVSTGISSSLFQGISHSKTVQDLV